MIPVHTFGDSHVGTLNAMRPDLFIPHGIISLTAYKMGNIIGHHPEIYNHYSKIPTGSRVLVSFGEIDCSLHIMKFIRAQNRSIADVTAENIAQYKKVLKYISNKHKIAAFGPYPGLYYDDDDPDTIYTHIGTFDEVLEVKAEFNNQLEELCHKQGWFFLTLYDDVMENEWYYNQPPFFYPDKTHLGPHIVPIVIEKLKNF